jgi:regulation of enolase protein 1 (concanavalin A-like superfamily)
MALIYDGITSAVYANGSLVSSNATTLNTSTANPFQIGAYGWQNNYFDGLIDDVRLYDKALTEDELNLVMRIDPLLAWNPSPMNGELTDVVKASTLTWDAGDMAADHDVYLGMDRAAVANADTADDTYQGQVGGTSFSVADPLAWDQQYYWRVDENNTDGSVTTGLVWSFATADFLIVDNFESYDANQDEGGNAVFLTWIDGFGDDGNGSLVGYIDPANGTFNETSDVHSGGQAMPFAYDNTTANVSEATRDLSPAEDWTLEDLTDLTIWYKGAPVDFVETDTGITMSAAGADIWNLSDEFRYAYDSVTGDVTVTAKVDSLVNTNAWAKAGVMIRETLEPGSKHAMMVVTPGNGVSFQARQFTADTSVGTTIGGIEAPAWVRLTRSGDTFTAQYSTDGVTWEDVVDGDGVPVAREITMTSTVNAGLALTSHATGVVTTAEFSEVDIDGSTPSFQVADVGVDHPGNQPDQLYVIVEDTAGGSATVEHPDGPSAVTVADWTPWKIPLTDLAGVNLTRVGTVTLGVGNANMDGTGTVLFDDIRVTKPEPVVEDPNEVVTE